jgi:tetratricopeptide (TPR) repeat protein
MGAPSKSTFALAVLLAAPGLDAQSCTGLEPKLAAGTAALERRDAAEAERVFSSAEQSQPDCPEAVLGLGRARMARGDFPGAYVLFSRYSRLRPQDARGYVAGAEVLLHVGRLAQADTLSAQALALDATSVDVLVLRGRILGMKDDTGGAEEMLVKACRLDPNSAKAHFELGVLYDRLQRNAKAVEQFEMVTRLGPGNAQAFDYLALNLEPLGQFERAERAYQQALKVNREPALDRFLDYNYGRFLMKLDRLEAARHHLDRAVELAPEARAVHYERAKLFEKLGQYQVARAESERAMALADPGGFILDLQVYYQLARIYTHLGETELAAKYTKLAQASNVPLQSRLRGGR